MKAWISKVVLYLATLAAAYLCLLFILANMGDALPAALRSRMNTPIGIAVRGDSTLPRFREIDTYADLDILFVGSSHCYRAFDTRAFSARGLHTFNMGSTAQTPLNSYYLLEQHLVHLRPRLVVQEIYWGVLANRGVESTLDLIENTALTGKLVEMALATRSPRPLNALIMRALDLRRPRLEGILHRPQVGDTYCPRGYVETARPGGRWRDPAREEIQARSSQFEYLVRSLELLRSTGASVLWVIQPVPRVSREAVTNLDRVLAELQGVAHQHDVTLLDFNRLMNLEDRQYYFDSHHLTQQGVTLFNARFIQELADRELLPAGR